MGISTLIFEGPTLTILDEVVQVLEVAQQGAQGPQGEPGQAGIAFTSYSASGNLGGHRAVRAAFSASVRYADSATKADASAVLGISLGAASDGTSINIATAGEIVEPSWAWTEGLPIFVGLAGALTQSPPSSGFQLVVGTATSPTSMSVSIKQPIIL